MGCTAEINEMVPSSETMSLYRVVSTVKLIYLYYAHQDAASNFEANAFLIMLLLLSFVLFRLNFPVKANSSSTFCTQPQTKIYFGSVADQFVQPNMLSATS